MSILIKATGPSLAGFLQYRIVRWTINVRESAVMAWVGARRHFGRECLTDSMNLFQVGSSSLMSFVGNVSPSLF